LRLTGAALRAVSAASRRSRSAVARSASLRSAAAMRRASSTCCALRASDTSTARASAQGVSA
jgi:hypothetical protein